MWMWQIQFLLERKWRENISPAFPMGSSTLVVALLLQCPVSKKQVKDKQFRLVIDLESIFLRLLMIGQQRQKEIEPVFACELCAVPPSLIDEHRCLRKATSQTLSNVLGYNTWDRTMYCWNYHCGCFTAVLPYCVATWWKSLCIHQKLFKSATNICQLISSHTTGTSPSHVMGGSRSPSPT